MGIFAAANGNMSMERLWAPWRMAYIESDKEGGPPSEKSGARCIFCEKARSTDPAADLVVHKGDYAFVLMNLYPYNNGHLMIAPYEHTARYDLLAEATLADMDRLAQRALRALGAAFHPDGYNTGMNLGQVAGAGIADHLHQHIVPRWSGDANFMPVIGETKVLPDSLENAYRKLVEAWV
jgi:ATP adenylyltransferase